MSEIISLEQKLTEQWTSAKAEAEATIEQANYNLGRIGLIYSGQLSFKTEEDVIVEIPERPWGVGWPE